MTPTRTALPALGLLLAFAGGAAAQSPPTPEQATALETQISAWLTASTAGAFTIPPRAVQLTPDGDHYDVRVPLAPLARTLDPADAALTGNARPLGGSRWALDNEQLPSEFSFATTQTVPDPPDAKNPSVDGTHQEPVSYHVKLGQQDLRGTFDTSFATPTTSGGSIASIDIVKQGGSGDATTHIGATTTQTTVNPVDASHADFLSDGGGEGYATKATMPDGSDFALQADRLRVVTAVSGLAEGQLVPLYRLVGQLASMVNPPGTDTTDGPTPEQKAQLHAMLQAATGILTGAKLAETVEGAKFEIAGATGSVARLELSLDGSAPADILSASVGVVLDGLVVDGLAPALATYVPTHVAFHPTVSNLSVSVLTKMGLDATAPAVPGQPAPTPDVAALFAHGGIKFGFDSLALDLAGAKLTGTGAFTSTGPQSVTGEADLSASGLDGLITKAQADPLLQQAVPVMIFLKGIAHTTGDQAVWQITVSSAKVLVNGVDLSAMAGAMSR